MNTTEIDQAPPLALPENCPDWCTAHLDDGESSYCRTEVAESPLGTIVVEQSEGRLQLYVPDDATHGEFSADMALEHAKALIYAAFTLQALEAKGAQA